MTHANDFLVTSIEARPIPWSDFDAELAALYAWPACSKSQATMMRQSRTILASLGPETTADLTLAFVTRFLDALPQPLSPYTVRKHLAHVRIMCNLAERKRYLTISPFRLRKMSSYVRLGRPKPQRFLRADEIKAILDVMRSDIATRKGWALWKARRLYALTATIAYLGTRAKEGQCLWVSDIDLVNRVVNITPHRGRLKTEASEAPVAMPPALGPILTEWLAHRLDRPEGFALPADVPWLFPTIRGTAPWCSGYQSSKPLARFQTVAARAGITGDDVTFQTLRRSWATIAEGLGIPQALITRQLRHTSEETTKRYYQQRDMKALGDATSAFEF